MEKLNLRSRFALLLTILIAPLAGVSAAGLIDSSTGYSAQGNTYGVVNGVKTETNVNNSASVSAGSAGIRTGVSASARATTTRGNNATTTNNGNAFGNNSNASASVTPGRYGGVDVNAGNSGNVIHIDRSSGEVTTNAGANVSLGAVRSNDDLKAFAATTVRNDPNMTSIDVAEDHLDVGYKQPARFLGFIPMTVNATVTVNQDGSVTVSYPWYSFLALTNRSDLESTLQNEVSAFLAERQASDLAAGVTVNASTSASSTVSSTTPSSGNPSMSGTVVLTPSVEASLIARIQAVLKAHLTNSSGNASSTQSES